MYTTFLLYTSNAKFSKVTVFAIRANWNTVYSRMYNHSYSHIDLLCWIIPSVFEGSSSNRDLNDVRNALYGEMSETPAGELYEMATSAVAGDGDPCEIPVSLHTSDGGNEK